MPPANNDSTPIRSVALRHRRFAPIIECAWVSLRGKGHDRNQDAVLVAHPLYAVADGVGGGSAGELASSSMLEYCRAIPRRTSRNADCLSKCLEQADEALSRNLREYTSNPSATTFAGVWLNRCGKGVLAHVGDARILHVLIQKEGSIVTQLTQDQTYGNLGETPPVGGKRDDPARMIGVGAAGVPPVKSVQLGEGELLVLCTDGLHRFVTTPVLVDYFQRGRGGQQSLAQLANSLAQAAREAGSQDDISVLLVRRNALFWARWPYWAALAGVLFVLSTVMIWRW